MTPLQTSLPVQPTGARRVPDAGSRARVERRALHGVLLLDKPVGLSSQDAMFRAKRLLRAQKAGHTGTLDPLACGLLPVCFGAATKFSHLALEADKHYVATLRLGQTRRGGDLEGEVLRERPVEVDEARLAQVLAAHTGRLWQVPPMHSALKHQGRPLYAYARQGMTLEREAREVQIHALELLGRQAHDLELGIRCSKGTYVRALAEDLGEALGCGAHLTALRRTGSGPLSLNQAVTLQALQDMDEVQRERCIQPVDLLLQGLPELRLDAAEAGRFLTGLRRRVPHPDAAAVRVYGPGANDLLGLAHITGGELIADRLLNPEEARAVACPIGHA